MHANLKYLYFPPFMWNYYLKCACNAKIASPLSLAGAIRNEAIKGQIKGTYDLLKLT